MHPIFLCRQHHGTEKHDPTAGTITHPLYPLPTPALARGSNSTLPYVGGRKQSWQRPRVAQGRLCGGAMLQMQARLLHARHR